MARVLIYVNEPRDKLDVFIDGLRRSVFGFRIIPTTEDTSILDHKFFDVDERDADFVIGYLTMHHPGCAVTVYTAVKSGIRPAGALTMKEISKDGELPV